MARPKRCAILLVALSLAAGAAQAQSPAASGDAPFLTRLPPGGVRGSKLVGVPVIGMDHTAIGKTEEVILDGQGRIKAVVIAVGGFLGIGEKRVAVPYDLIAWNTGTESIADAIGPRSSTTPDTAPSQAAADKAGPETMPGAKVADEVLGGTPAELGGTTSRATGSTDAARQPAQPATVQAVGSGDGPVRAEIRLTKAALQAAPAFRYEADAKP